MRVDKFILKYIANWFLLLDLAVNTLLFGDPQETISSRIGKQVQEGHCVLCKWVCKGLDLIDKRHCHDSIDPNQGAGSGDKNDELLK